MQCIYSPEQVYDHDLIGEDDFLGKSARCTVSEVVSAHDRTEHTVTLGKGRGALTFQTEWRDPTRTMQRKLSVVYATPPRDPDGTIAQDYALLEVCLNSIDGLQSAIGVSYKLRVEVDTGDKTQQIDAQEARGVVPWRSPVLIEEQIDNFKLLTHAGVTTAAEHGEVESVIRFC